MPFGIPFLRRPQRRSVLPQVRVEPSTEGVRVLAPVPGLRDALRFWFLALFLALFLLVVAFLSNDRAKQFQAVISMAGGFGFVAELGRRYFRQRKLERATLLVARWPLCLGDKVKVQFENRLKKGDEVRGLSARLICFEEAIYSSGKQQQTRKATRHEVPLDTSRAQIDGRSVRDAWNIEIPATGLPSLSLKKNFVHWRVETLVDTGGVEVSGDFELIVVPEVAN